MAISGTNWLEVPIPYIRPIYIYIHIYIRPKFQGITIDIYWWWFGMKQGAGVWCLSEKSLWQVLETCYDSILDSNTKQEAWLILSFYDVFMMFYASHNSPSHGKWSWMIDIYRSFWTNRSKFSKLTFQFAGISAFFGVYALVALLTSSFPGPAVADWQQRCCDYRRFQQWLDPSSKWWHPPETQFSHLHTSGDRWAKSWVFPKSWGYPQLSSIDFCFSMK